MSVIALDLIQKQKKNFKITVKSIKSPKVRLFDGGYICFWQKKNNALPPLTKEKQSVTIHNPKRIAKSIIAYLSGNVKARKEDFIMNNLRSTRTDDITTLNQFSPEVRIAGQMFERLSDEEKEFMLQIMRQLVNEGSVQEEVSGL